ncbi:MAG: ubiquitin-like small modifier protein 1 [Candidatus Hodarchaeales archaeon]
MTSLPDNTRITIKVKLFATFRQLTNINELILTFNEQQPTVYDVLKALCDKYPQLQDQIFDDSNQFKEWNHALINGRNVRFLEGLNTRLNDNDVLSVFPPVAGG